MSSMGVMNLYAMETAAGELCAYPLSAPARSALRAAMNVSYHMAVNAYDWPQLTRNVEVAIRKGDESGLALFETGDSYVPILPEIADPVSLHVSGNDVTLPIRTQTEFYEYIGGQSLSFTGHPTVACYAGTTSQYRKLPAAGALRVKSSSAANNSTIVPSVLYQVSDGVTGNEVWEDVNGNFTTGVALASNAAAGYPIKAVSIPAGWAGTLTIETSDGVTEIVKVQPVRAAAAAGSSALRYYAGMLLRVWPTPAVDDKGVLVYRLRPQRLTENNDVPLIPVTDYLIQSGCAAIYARDKNMEMIRYHEAKAQESLLRSWRDVPTSPRRFRPARGNIYRMSGFNPGGDGWP